MSKQRIIKDEMWDDDWFYDLDPSEKLVWVFLLTNPRSNIAGVYKANIRWIANQTGFDKDVIKNILERFVKNKKILWENDWIGLVNFYKHLAYRNDNVKKGIERLHAEMKGDTYPLKGFERLWVTLLNSTLLNLSVSGEKSPAIKNKDMWNKQGEDTDQEFVVDFDGDGETTDLKEEEKKLKAEQTKKRAEMRKYVKGLRDGLGLPALDAKQMNWQLKDYQVLLDRGWSHKQIGEEFIHIVSSDLWKEKVKNKEYPGINTVEYSLRNKTP